MAQQENAELKTRVADLQDPIKGILADKDKRIADMLRQVEEVIKDRNDCMFDLREATDTATQTKVLADRATQAQKQAETTLATVQADRDGCSALLSGCGV